MQSMIDSQITKLFGEFMCKISRYLPYDHYLNEAELHVVDLSYKYCRHCLIEGGTVHVDGGANRQDESGDTCVQSQVLLQTFEGHR